MERRRFLNLAALAGLSIYAPLGLRGREAEADEGDNYTGKFYIMINAGGGWDPTFSTDPKGGDIDHPFMPNEILSAGNIRYAPIEYGAGNMMAATYSNKQFFEAYYKDLLVLNGVDTTTNNHDTGNRITWSGQLDEGFPAISALIAGGLAPSLPTAFISNGGYDFTGDVVPLTRVNNVDTIKRIAYPNLADPNNTMSGMHSDATSARIAQYQNARLTALTQKQTLPAYNAPMSQLLLTRGGSNDLQRMIKNLPTNDQLNAAGNDLVKQAMIAFAAYKAGISVSVNLNTGGFDTHGNHDQAQASALGFLLQGIDGIMQQVKAQGLQDKVVIMVGSDFGRTPTYNMNMGKDHWTITSVWLMGAGIPGNRVLGGTDASQLALGVDAKGGISKSSGAAAISPQAIHLAMRQFAGVDTTAAARKFPLAGVALQMFS